MRSAELAIPRTCCCRSTQISPAMPPMWRLSSMSAYSRSSAVGSGTVPASSRKQYRGRSSGHSMRKNQTWLFSLPPFSRLTRNMRLSGTAYTSPRLRSAMYSISNRWQSRTSDVGGRGLAASGATISTIRFFTSGASSAPDSVSPNMVDDILSCPSKMTTHAISCGCRFRQVSTRCSDAPNVRRFCARCWCHFASMFKLSQTPA